MPTASSLRWDIRRTSWLLRTMQIRKAGRAAFDLIPIGSGILDRICSALLYCCAFFFSRALPWLSRQAISSLPGTRSKPQTTLASCAYSW